MPLKTLVKSLRFRKPSIESFECKSEFVTPFLEKLQSGRLTPEALEGQFLLQVTDACNCLPIPRKVHVGLVSNVLHKFDDTKCPAELNLIVAVPTLPSAREPSAQSSSPVTLSGSTAVDSPPPTICPEPIPTQRTAEQDQPLTGSPPARVLSIKDFVIVRLLGKGSSGAAFLVLDMKTDKQFAVKIIPKANLTPSRTPRIFEERRVMQSLVDCPWAISVQGSFEDSKNFYILMDYCLGGDVMQRIDEEILDYDAIKLIAAEMIVGVEELHKRRIIHRDIKPENLLIDDDGHIVLADFGLAKDFGADPAQRMWENLPTWSKWPSIIRAKSDTSQAGGTEHDSVKHIAGTPGYVAPEVFLADRHSYAVDIFSMGATIFYMAYDRVPYPTKVKGLTREVMREAIKTPFELDEDDDFCPLIKDLLRKMLDTNPATRATIPQIKDHPFFFDIEWGEIAARTNTPFHKSVIFQRRMPDFHIDKSDVLPYGDDYEANEAPHPWFGYVGPALLEPLPDTTADHSVIQDQSRSFIRVSDIARRLGSCLPSSATPASTASYVPAIMERLAGIEKSPRGNDDSYLDIADVSTLIARIEEENADFLEEFYEENPECRTELSGMHRPKKTSKPRVRDRIGSTYEEEESLPRYLLEYIKSQGIQSNRKKRNRLFGR